MTAGTGGEDVNDDGVYVDIYAASRIKWQHNDKTVTIKTETAMPYDTLIKICVNVAPADKFKLILRIPAWTSDKIDININGEKCYTGKPGSYCTILRTWKNNDTVQFKLPVKFQSYKYTGADQIEGYDRYAFMYGPILYAVIGKPKKADSNFIMNFDVNKLNKNLIAANKPLTFEIKNNPDCELMPYFEISNQTFTCFPCFKKD